MVRVGEAVYASEELHDITKDMYWEQLKDSFVNLWKRGFRHRMNELAAAHQSDVYVYCDVDVFSRWCY